MHPVLLTILRRLGLGLVTLLLVSIIIFSSINMLPGDFGEAVLGQASAQIIQQISDLTLYKGYWRISQASLSNERAREMD